MYEYAPWLPKAPCVKGAVTAGDWGIVYVVSFQSLRLPIRADTSLCTREALPGIVTS